MTSRVDVGIARRRRSYPLMSAALEYLMDGGCPNERRFSGFSGFACAPLPWTPLEHFLSYRYNTFQLFSRTGRTRGDHYPADRLALP